MQRAVPIVFVAVALLLVGALSVVVGFFLGGLDRVFAELFNRGIFAVFQLF